MSDTDNNEYQLAYPQKEGMDKPKEDWFSKYWYLAIFPTFVFAVGIRWGVTTWNPGTVGFILACVLVYFVTQIEDIRLAKALTFIIPVVFLGFVVLVPFPGGEVHHPRLTISKVIGRASVSATFGVLLLLGTVGAMKLFRK
jgi:hypothetical protein